MELAMELLIEVGARDEQDQASHDLWSGVQHTSYEIEVIQRNSNKIVMTVAVQSFGCIKSPILLQNTYFYNLVPDLIGYMT